MSTANPIQIVVAFDFTPASELALARAVEVVARSPRHVLHIAAVLERGGQLAGARGGATYQDAARLQVSVSERVAAAFAGRDTADEVQFYVHARIGHPAEEILELARQVGAELIFVGADGKTGLERMLLGSVSERVVREAECPVMVVRAKSYPEVELSKVVRYDHPREPHAQPHLYSYSNKQVRLRPKDWPLA